MQTFLPKELYIGLIGHQEDPDRQEGEDTIINSYYRDVKTPNMNMTIKWQTDDKAGVLNGSKLHTLHPAETGHKAVREIIVERLKQVTEGS